MTRRLYHPLWTHLPAVALIIALAVKTLRALPLPARAPIHFGAGGQPNGWGSPLAVSLFLIGLSLLYLALSALGDEMWARHERRKRFNWFSLLDEGIIGFLVATQSSYLNTILVRSTRVTFTFPGLSILAVVVPAVLVAVVLEVLRPHLPHEAHVPEQDASATEQSITSRLQAGQPAVYWESQNPHWMKAVSIAVTIWFLVGAVSTWGQAPWISALLLALVALFPLLYGGLRVLLTREAVTVRLGLLGLRVLRVKLTDITAVELREFSPLADFGGWGIRYGRGGVVAYFLSGNVGVQLTTARGRKYLLGSNHPDRLAAAIRAFREHR